MFTSIFFHFNFLCPFSSSLSPPFSIYFLIFFFVVCIQFLLGSSSSSCQLAFLLFCCFIVLQLYFIISIYKGWPTLCLDTELLIVLILSLVCFYYLKKYFSNGLSLFSCRWRQHFSPKHHEFYTHKNTHLLPQSNVTDKLLWNRILSTGRREPGRRNRALLSILSNNL